MDNADFDYSFQYRNLGHLDTDKSRQREMGNWRGRFKQHAIFPPSKDAAILEIGCGMGRLLAMLKKEGYTNLTGIDIDRSQIDVAQKEEGIAVSLIDATEFLSKEISANRKYDAIYLYDVLEHIAKEKQLPFLKLLHEHLTENGFIVIQVPGGVGSDSLYCRYNDFTHCLLYTPLTLSFLIRNAGFPFLTVRPWCKEPLSWQRAKLPFIRPLRVMNGITDTVTFATCMLAVVFKNEAVFKEWEAKAPVIDNAYLDGIYGFMVYYFGDSIQFFRFRWFIKPIEQWFKHFKKRKKVGKIDTP